MNERVPSPPLTPIAEREQIAAAQEIEQQWWAHVEPVRTVADIEALIEAGEAVYVTDTPPLYRLSERAPQEFNVLRVESAELLNQIATLWKQGVSETHFLVVTSLARTVSYQQELQERGYPTVEQSSHTKCVAFDISTAWFLEHDVGALQQLVGVLDDLQQAGRLNYILEPTVKVVHVCVRPQTSVALES